MPGQRHYLQTLLAWDISAVDGVVLALMSLLNGENVDFVGIPIGITHDIPTENTT
jgi:hypothetical protein